MDNIKIENVHISQILPGDTVQHNNKITTVNKEYIKYCSFMGKSIFGDNYRLGTKLVKRIIFVTNI